MHIKELFSWALFHLNFVNSLSTTLFAFNFKILEFFYFNVKIWSFGSVESIENELL
jgi:hypothetical protein